LGDNSLESRGTRGEEATPRDEADSTEPAIALASPEEQAAAEIAGLSEQEFAEFAKSLGEKSVEHQRAFLQLLASKPHKETRKRWKKKKADLWTSVIEVADKLKIDLS